MPAATLAYRPLGLEPGSVSHTVVDDESSPSVIYGSNICWQMNKDQQLRFFDLKVKNSASSSGITLVAGRSVHWDILVRGNTAAALTLAVNGAIPGTTSSWIKLSTENGATLFRFFLSPSESEDIHLSPNDQFRIAIVNPGSATDIQLINSDEFVNTVPLSQKQYNLDAINATRFDSGTPTESDDRDWLSTDNNGGELAVTNPAVQTGVSVDYRAGNDQAYGTTAADTLRGDDDNDFIDGRAGSDTLSGGEGKDVLMGGLGNDNLSGGEGDDTLFGGQGNDTLSGDGGSDVFRWRTGDQGVSGKPAIDIIKDFNLISASSGGDVLDLRDLLIDENDSLDAYLNFSGNSSGQTLIEVFANGAANSTITQTITLENVQYTALKTYAGGIGEVAILDKLLLNGNLIGDHF